VTEDQIAALDISIGPDGAGLPAGSGTVEQGAAVYALHCQSCHGPEGANGQPGVPRLTGGLGSLASEAPLKTVNSYWPYATGVFDYVRRSMPPTNTRALEADELYAVTAYILSLDGVVAADAVLDAETLPDVVMPNREGFVPWWPTPGG
jgi:cytochrome c